MNGDQSNLLSIAEIACSKRTTGRGLSGLVLWFRGCWVVIRRFGQGYTDSIVATASADRYLIRQVIQDRVTKLEYFKVFREHRICEQNLINHRLTWNLAIQGFLFATYGFCLQKVAELQSGESQAHIAWARDAIHELRTLLEAIPWLGIFLSLFVFLSIMGAKFSLSKLRHDWQTEIENKCPHEPFVPNPAGGGSSFALWLGLLPPLLIPAAFAAAWAWVVLCS